MTISARLAAALLLPCLAAACGTEGSTTLLEDQAGTSDSGSGEVARLETVDSMAPDLKFAESAGTDHTGEAGGPDQPGCEMGSGCFEDPCAGNEDCLSGLCIDHLGDKVCTDYCVEECPLGWVCEQVSFGGPDLSFACVSDFPTLCRPCTEDGDCTSAAGQENLCLDYGTEGRFCGAGCNAGQECPEGFHCVQASTPDGTAVTQCTASAGVCECSQTSISLALSTPCVGENDFGTCVGQRVCTETGLSPCDALEPSLEECDGLDNDCDGDIDEDTCDDGNPCTKDGCVPADGCLNQELDEGACDDGDGCTLGDLCQAGICTGEPVTCNDGNECTEDLCDAVSGCSFPDKGGPCEDGDPCTFGDFCEEAQCQSGVGLDCDDDNPCTADLCGASGCGHEAVAGPCDDSDPCSTGDKCQDGVCVFTGQTECQDGNACTSDWCDPLGGCQFLPNEAACNDGDMCTLDDTCTQAECLGGATLNCDDSNPCTNDTCNPLLGCKHTNNMAPCDDLDPCTLQDQCVGGMCVGTGAADCEDGNPCTTDYCDPMAGCTHVTNAVSCDDGNACTFGDKCQGGTCAAGQQVACIDGNPCTDDSCDPGAGCLFEPNTLPCDDGNACTTDDHCAGGACMSDQPVACDDGNPCTKDICLPNGGCAAEPTAGPCDDGDACTVSDACSAGQCASGLPLNCDDGNPCTTDSCDVESGCTHAVNDLPCSDSNPCTIDDVCQEGMCAPGAALECDDDNVCTTDYCEPATGCSFHTNTLPCNDGDICTTNDECSQGACQGGAPLPCNDGNPCTVDSCAPEFGCTFTPGEGACDDSNACTEEDHCSGGFCVGGKLAECSDGNPCTSDGCDIDAGCINLGLDIPCSDGNACTAGDWCVEGECTAGGPANCDDGNVCTADSCDPADGCHNTPEDGGCSDDDACTVDDSCAAGVCIPGAPLICDDSNVCTADSCAPATGCQNDPAPGACTDGNECTTGDTCTDGQCQSSGVLSCDDGDQCTENNCNPDDGCVYPPIAPCCGNGAVEAGEECDDGNITPGDGCDAQCKSEVVQAPECQNYATLTESNRHVNFNDGNGGVEICDSGLNGWHRFTGGAGTRMPTSCPSKFSCGTDAPGWMQGSHPSVNDGAVSRTVCYHWDSSCCKWSNTIQVRNCGDFYVFKLNGTPACHLRYCGAN